MNFDKKAERLLFGRVKRRLGKKHTRRFYYGFYFVNFEFVKKDLVNLLEYLENKEITPPYVYAYGCNRLIKDVQFTFGKAKTKNRQINVTILTDVILTVEGDWLVYFPSFYVPYAKSLKELADHYKIIEKYFDNNPPEWPLQRGEYEIAKMISRGEQVFDEHGSFLPVADEAYKSYKDMSG